MKPKANPRLVSALPALLFLLPFAAQGQTTVFFNGPDNGVWSDNTNWAGGTKPTSAQIAGINGNSGSTSVVDADFNLGSVGFSGSTGRSISINSGVALILHGTGTTPSLISNAGNQNLSITGAGAIRLANSGTINVTSATRFLSLSTQITETGGARQIVKTGLGALNFLNSASLNTFSGGVRLTEGTLSTNVGSSGTANSPTSGPFGTGTLALEGGTMRYTGNTAGITFHNRVTISGNVAFGETANPWQSFILAGDIDLTGGSRTLSFHQAVTASGVISNGSLAKTGASTLELSGANTYGGTTTITEGTLSLSGAGSIASSSRIEIAAGATLNVANAYALAANQVLSGAGNVTGTLRTGGGIVEAGGSGALGQITVDGNGLLDGGTLRFELSATDNDRLVFTGENFTLSGNTAGAVQISLLDFDGTAGPGAPGEYLLISTSGMADGNFEDWGLSAFTLADLPSGWIGNLRFENQNLYFDAIPEPRSYILLLGTAAAGLLLHRRRALRQGR